MSLDAIVVNPGRLRILTALAVEERQEFVRLRSRTQLTDGNLAAHAKRLQSAGMIDVDKQFRDGKPVTSFVLTTAGRKALESHARRLLAAISHRRVGATAAVEERVEGPVTTTVAVPVHQAPPARAPEPAPSVSTHSSVEDDWVD